MALKWVDSFDGYQTAQLGAKYIYTGSTIVAGQGRRGTNALYSAGAGVAFPIAGDPYTFMGWAGKYAQADITNGLGFCAFLNGGNAALLFMQLNVTGGINVSGFGGNFSQYLIGSTIGGYVIANEYHQYEVDIKWTTDTTGYIHFYRDSVFYTSLTGIRTMSSYVSAYGFPTLAALSHHPQSGMAGCNDSYFDDLYLCDSSGSVHNTGPIGDKKVVIMIPNGAGNKTQFAVTGESANWQAVSQDPPLYDSAYVSSTTIDDEDTYTLTTPATSFTGVDAVAVTVLARKDDAGDRTISAGVGNGTTEAYGTAYGLGAEYTYAQTLFDGTNPLTSVGWIPSDLTTLEAALKIAS